MIQLVRLFPKLSEDQKIKRSSLKIEECLSLKSGEDQKKGLYRNLALYSAGTSGIYLC